MSTSEWKKTQCSFCEVCCGLEVKVEGNKIVDVRPDPDSPRSPGGYCCRKGRSTKYFQDNPDRLNYPLKRVGNEFVRISWDQAIKEIGEKARDIISKHGPGAVCHVGGGNAAFAGATAAFGEFIAEIGTEHLFSPVGLEFMGFFWSVGRIFGNQSNFTEPDEQNCDVLLFWGSNSYVSHNLKKGRMVIREFSENPDKMFIDVDPRLSETARMADMHVAPRFGSDALLIRGLIAMILDKGWQDQAFLDKWALDFDKIKPWFEGFDYRKAFEVARVPYEQMEELAKIMCTRSVGCHMDLGLYMGRHNTANAYLTEVLLAITGNLLVKGTILMHSFFQFPACDERDPNHVRAPETGKFRVAGFYPCGILSKEFMSKRDDRFRMMVCSGSNPARSYPDSNAIEEGMENLELSVDLELVMTETARHCDYVLPATDSYEAYNYCQFLVSWPDVPLTLKHPFLEPIGERKEDGEIYHLLTKEICQLPDPPEFLYQLAEQAAATQDRVPFMGAVQQFIGENPEWAPHLIYIVMETLGKAMGSYHKAGMWLLMNISPHVGSDRLNRAGWEPNPAYAAMGPQVAALSQIDNIFRALENTPEGVVGAISDFEDREHYAFEAISHPDHKLHLWCQEIEDYLDRITPEKEEAELSAEDREFPMLLSAGRHIDGGVNGMMRNPATYVYRSPYVVYMNPQDAEALGLAEGQEVRVTTKASSLDAPIEYDWGAERGYILIPHHYGFETQGKTVGMGVNRLADADYMDELTGNPINRYIPCRVEAV